MLTLIQGEIVCLEWVYMCMSLCVCTCEQCICVECAHVNACICTVWRWACTLRYQKTPLGGGLSFLSCLRQGFLLEFFCDMCQTGCLEASRESTSHLSGEHQGYKCWQHMSDFYVNLGDLNLGLHSCLASIFTHWVTSSSFHGRNLCETSKFKVSYCSTFWDIVALCLCAIWFVFYTDLSQWVHTFLSGGWRCIVCPGDLRSGILWLHLTWVGVSLSGSFIITGIVVFAFLYSSPFLFKEYTLGTYLHL